MKVAVVCGGVVRGNIERNFSRFDYCFKSLKPDYFFSHWKDETNTKQLYKFLESFPYDSKVYEWDRPPLTYHPWGDIPDEVMPESKKFWGLRDVVNGKKPGNVPDKVKNSARQILNHAMFLDEIDSKYDMIIRVRYDTLISMRIDWVSWIKESYNDGKAIGFGIRDGRWNKWHSQKRIPQRYPKDDKEADIIGYDWASSIIDPMMFHPRK